MNQNKSDGTEDRFIFITTPMRSGSTLLTRMLSAHPLVDISYDSLNFFRYCYGRYDPMYDPVQRRRLLEDTSYRLQHRFGMELDVERCYLNIGDQDFSYGQVYRTILRELFKKTGKTVLGDKEALAWTKIPSFLEMCPNGKVVVILRDPRDVVVSFKKMTIAPANDYLIALFNVIDAVNHALMFKRKFPSQVHIVGFERLKLNTEHELRNLCEFLELEFSEDMLRIEGFKDRLGNQWDSSLAMSFEGETDWLAPVGRWKTLIDPEDLFICQYLARDQISSLGLQLDIRPFGLDSFNSAINKLMSSELLMTAFKRWFESGEGMEVFPLDPLNPVNWQPGDIKTPSAFDDGFFPTT